MKSHLSRPASQNSVADVLESAGKSNASASELQNKSEQPLLSERTFNGLSTTSQSVNPSLTRSELLGKSPSVGLIDLGNGVLLAENLNPATLDARNFSPSGIFEIADVEASLAGLSMSRGQPQMGTHKPNHQQQQQHYSGNNNSRAEHLIHNINYANLMRNNSSNIPHPVTNEGVSLPRRTASTTNLQSQQSGYSADQKPDTVITNGAGSSFF